MIAAKSVAVPLVVLKLTIVPDAEVRSAIVPLVIVVVARLDVDVAVNVPATKLVVVAFVAVRLVKNAVIPLKIDAKRFVVDAVVAAKSEEVLLTVTSFVAKRLVEVLFVVTVCSSEVTSSSAVSRYDITYCSLPCYSKCSCSYDICSSKV